MGYHGVNLFNIAIELDGLTTIFVSVGAGLLVKLLRGVLLEYYLRTFHSYLYCSGPCTSMFLHQFYDR